MSSRTSILIVDDNPIDIETYSRYLERECEGEYEILGVASGGDALDAARERSFDCAVIDYGLPDMDGLELLRGLVGDPADVELPVVGITGQGNEAIAVEMMRAGAQDYLSKGNVGPATLVRAVHNAIERVSLRRKLKEHEADLQRAREEQLAMKDRFLSHVSHELRTPLTAIKQFVSLVLDEIPGPINAEQREFLEVADRNTRQLAQMIGDLMDSVRAQSGKLRIELGRLDLGKVLEAGLPAQRSLAEANGIEFVAAIGSLPTVLADPLRVQQVITNLIDNAVKFTPQGGRIELRAEIDPQDDEAVRISVRDSGCGMSAEAAAHAFDRMFQAGGEQVTSRAGLGIGLSICHDLVSQQQGRLWVESEPDKGSDFHFTLPRFSLHELLLPALFERGVLRPRSALLRVTPRSRTGATLTASDTRRLHNVLGRLVYYPHLDVLLPRGLAPHDSNAMFVIAATDAAGLSAIASRLRGFFEDAGSPVPEFEFDIETRLVDGLASADGPDEALTHRLEAIENLIFNTEEW